MNNSNPEPAIGRPIRIRLSLRTNFVFFPIEHDVFINSLEKRGYVIKRPPQVAGPMKFEVVGQIAQKEENIVTYDSNRQIIAVDGISPKDVVYSFNELEEIIRSELNVDISESILFYEMISEYHITSEKSPRLVLEKTADINKFCTLLSKVIGIEVTPFGFRFGSKGLLPNQAEWFDLRIEPVVRKADSLYFCNIVYRSIKGDKIKDFVTALAKINENIRNYFEEHI